MLVGDIVTMRIASTWGAQTALNVVHYRVSAIGAAGITLAQAAAAMDGLIAATYKLNLTDKAVYRGVDFQKIWPLPISLSSAAIANLGAGSVGADPLPKQISGLAVGYTAIGGRGQRARFFMPWSGESLNTVAGVPDAVYTSNLAALMAIIWLSTRTITSGGNSNTFIPIVWHRVAKTYNDIINIVTRGLWATQRKRGDFGRSNAAPF